MEKKQQEVQEAQGAEVQEVKKQKESPSYTVRQYGAMIAKLERMGMTDEEDTKALKAIGEKIVKRFLGLDLFK